MIGYILLLTLFCFAMAKVNNYRFYPRYHLAPPYGWMNDPNGFSYYRNEYHLFYQFNPYSSFEAGTAHWGHAKSEDLFNWIHLPIAMYPDADYDRDGVFSGSAIVEEDTIYVFYTGQVKHENENPDHENRQALSISTDGLNFTKYERNPIIAGDEYQPDFRDPKVWKNGNTYYMVLGNSYKHGTLGRVLLFKSNDKISWEYASVIDQSDSSLGYMWECPDFFELDGKSILLFSPQGVEPQGDKYRNLYQTGYKIGHFDYSSFKFEIETEFVEIDNGHDFYATQTFLDKLGRRILIAWFDMWEQNYPEMADGFTGHMTIPRVLTLGSNGKILQNPVEEIEAIKGTVLRSGIANGCNVVTLEDNAAEVKIEAQTSKDFVLFLEAINSTVIISYDHINGTVSVNRGGEDGLRRTKWQPEEVMQLRIYIDASSIELFCGKGEVTFSSRFFPYSKVSIRLGEQSVANDMTVTSLKRTMPKLK